jgi:Fic family protein
MSFIHEQPGWPSLSWESESLAGPLAAVRHRQGKHLGRMEALGFDLRAEAQLATLTSDVVKSSAIEGEILSADEVRSSIAIKLGLDVGGLPRPGRRVEGFVEMMLDATRNFAAPLTAERLFGWHAALFPTGRSGMGTIAVGAFRSEDTGPMQVVSGALGRERVHFEAPHVDRVESEMTSFLDWLETPQSIDPVLVAGVAHFWFVTVHPFEDGNGRIARAIGDMALARADGTAERYYSLSTQIEADRAQYYRELEAAQRGGLDITRWLLWFLDCLDRSVTNADETLASVLHKASLWERVNARPVNERQRLVINRLLDNFDGFLTNAKYAKLAKCSPDTALRDVRELLNRGILVKNPGGGRSTSYRLADPE